LGNPHDTLFHFTFQHAPHTASWLQSLLPPALVHRIRWNTLRPVPDRLHGRALRLSVGDVVFSAKYLEARGRAFVLIEHRSHGDLHLHGTMVRYSVHLANSLRRDRSDPETPVLAIVLYHGPAPLAVRPAPIHPLAAVDPAVEELVREAQPRLNTFQDDLGPATEVSLLARGMTPLATLTLLSLRFLPGQDPASALASIDRWGPLLRAIDSEPGPPVGGEAIETFGWYVLFVTEASPDDVHMAIQRHLQRPEEYIVSTAERLRREGMEQGMATGELQGRAATLQRQLARRFGPLPASIEARLRSASIAELELWTDRVLDAGSLDAVFAAP
jgi:predicted transposase YdaD